MESTSQHSIEKWLKSIEPSAFSTNETETKVTVQVQEAESPPSTPPRRSTVAYNKASPTDTSFSGPSVFDPGLRKNPDFNSPRSDCGHDDSSDTTITKPFHESPTTRKYTAIGQTTTQPHPYRRISPPTTLSTSSSYYDPVSIYGNTNISTTHISPLFDPNDPSLVCITSCLQCTILSLPCSRTHPACSRCIRKGYGTKCLLYRRLVASEIEKQNEPTSLMLLEAREKLGEDGELGEPESPTSPVLPELKRDLEEPEQHINPILLKVKGEDEEVWKSKVELERGLLKEWAEKQERNNWALPAVCGRMGGWRSRFEQGDRRGKHPGEGVGRFTLKELVVAVDTVLEKKARMW